MADTSLLVQASRGVQETQSVTITAGSQIVKNQRRQHNFNPRDLGAFERLSQQIRYPENPTVDKDLSAFLQTFSCWK
jgi:hypothetical protein